MQIQLKQAEIVKALKQFITGQGINLAGKDVDISFTAGRKEAGLTADIFINDTQIPGVVADAEEAVKPTLTVVPTSVVGDEPSAVEAVKEPTDNPRVDVAAKSQSLFS